MKLGCCINMLADKQDIIGRKYIKYLAQYGYDYVEIPLAQVMELSDVDFKNLIQELKQSNIPCECCNNFFPKEIRLTGNDVSIEVIEDYIKKAMLRANMLGAKVIVFGSAGAKNIPEGFPYDKAFQQIVNVLKIVDKYAMQYNILIAIEPLNHLESNIILNLTDSNRLIKSESYHNIKLLVDYYHFMMEHESAEILKQSMRNIVHVHFANPDGRIYPSELKPEYHEFLNILKDYQYQGRFSIEAYSKDIIADLQNFANVFSSLK